MANNVNKRKNGYMFNQKSGKLESYELIGVKFRDNQDECVYTFILGGVEKTLSTNKIYLYENEEDFKRQKQMPEINLENWEINRYIRGYHSGFVYRFNGQAEKIHVEDIELYYNAKSNSVSVVDGTEYYESMEDCYLWNDIVVVEEDGTERVVEALATKVQLTDKQTEIVKQLTANLKALHKLGVEFAYDSESGFLKCLNVNNIHYEGVRYSGDFDEDEDESTDITKCATTIDFNISYLGYDDLLLGKREN